ncbi:hypothetical protein N7519_004168 [Penicillium mononematosum]|uniref:uncharacterized protein n=1 Tax=Penicillium mononematosum TaxID=268346 RepID=UPI002547EC73|nr:uncharacterized protein N7519_004168 [Penicillium mononematosum]KAJ6189260.1 hypothetical protein N7519_004168 [Penicillium mononematosum]
MAEKDSNSSGKIAQLEQVVAAALPPAHSNWRWQLHAKTLADMAKTAVTGKAVDDRDYIMERVIQLASGLPSTSRNGKELTNTFLTQLWGDLEHPPISYLGRDAAYRKADGSGNNTFWPQIGAANTPYARSVRPKTMQPVALPEPEALFDSLLARKNFKEHPNKISSVLFHLASIIIHDLFQTDPRDQTKSLTSSYLDLSPLYGNNQKEQDTVRTFKDGKLKPDCFSTKRVLGFPPGVGVILIMFNRFHNSVVTQLAAINEGGRFTKPDESNAEAYATWDNDLFQTARLVTCGLYINIILKDYVRTILNVNRTDSLWSLDPRADIKDGLLGEAPSQATGNQVSAEFNLVYRWHSCVSSRDEKCNSQGGLRQWESKLPADPQERPFAKLQRQTDGKFNDNDLVKIFEESVEDPAGAFGALNVPDVFRGIEVLGIKQARSWNLATLNEFRQYFGLAAHQTFEEINPDPYIANQLKHFYDHPDLVELYPGLVVEETKQAMTPGSGLCTNFTTSRAILSDAVALVRGDRFYTVDFTPKHLTNWAFNEINNDVSVDGGQVFYKLILKAFPNHFRGDSVYAHFPLVVPDENKKILTSLGKVKTYSFDRPFYKAPPLFINSHSACTKILKDQEGFKVVWGEKIQFLMENSGRPYGRDFALSGDLPANAASRKMIGAALHRDKWESEVKAFYEDITLKLLERNSFKVAGVNQVDIVRDVAVLAQVNFCANVFSLSLKTESNPRGVFSEQELYQILAVIFASIFYDVDVSKSLQLCQTARNVAQQLGELTLANVELVAKTGFISNLVNRLHRHDILSEYGIHMIQRLLDSQLPVKDVVWSHILPTAGALVANQGQLFSQCIDYYLSEEAAEHLAEIQRLSREDTPEADELLVRYFMEGARLRCSVALPRFATKPAVVDDNGKKVTLKAGQEIICNLVVAGRDPVAFPDPDKVRLDRDMSLYTHFGFGPHECLGVKMCPLALSTMLKVLGRLDNVRRAPGPQGHLKRLDGLGGIAMYMDAEHSSFSPFPMTMKIQWDGDLPARRE